MDPWIAKAVTLIANLAMVAIRAPHGRRSRQVRVARSGKGPLETVLLTCAWLGFLLPLLWVFTPLFRFADYPLRPALFFTGLPLLVLGLWLLYRSHADLGTNWSVTLELRENHQLVSHGIYRSVRHPMYLALFLYSIGLALVIPNWVAGPAYLVTFGTLFAFRVGREERMMLEQFGEDYERYRAGTKRLIPGIW